MQTLYFLYFCPVVCSSSSFILSWSNLSHHRLDVCHTSTHNTWCGLSANLQCRSEMCSTWLAENTRRKKSPKNRHMRSITQVCRAIFSQLRHLSTIGKHFLNSRPNISSTCPYNKVNFGPLTAESEICWGVWGTPAYFSGFRLLASLQHRRRSTEVNQTLHNI